MSFFTNLFSTGAAAVIDSIGGVIDDIVTSDEERLKLNLAVKKEINKFKVEQLDAAATYEAELTKRHSNDMKSDSWLSKNIRPLALAFLTISTVLLAYLTIFILEVEEAALVEPWTALFTALLLTVYGFYFGSRGVEKVQKIRSSK